MSETLPTIDEQLAVLPAGAVLNAYGISANFAANHPDLVKGGKWAIVLLHDRKQHRVHHVVDVSVYESVLDMTKRPQPSVFNVVVKNRDPKAEVYAFGYMLRSDFYSSQEEAEDVCRKRYPHEGYRALLGF